MLFRRQSQDGSRWVGVSQSGAIAHAVEVIHAPGERPRVGWTWTGDAEGLPQALRSLQKVHPLDEARLVVCLDPAAYRLVATEAPDVPREEWADALRWGLREQVDFAVDDAIIDVLEVPEATRLRQSNPTLTAVMARPEHAAITQAADDLGLQWAAMELPETTLRNLCALAEEDDKAHALLAFGESQGLLVITYRKELVMMRHIEVPLSAMTGSIEGRNAALNRAALEVLRTLDTFERVHSQITLDRLSVVPPTGQGDEVIALLAEQVYVPVQALQLGLHIDASALTQDASGGTVQPGAQALMALGAALRPQVDARGGQQLNMVDPAAVMLQNQSWNAQQAVRWVSMAAAFCLVGGLGLQVWAYSVQVRADQSEAAMKTMQASLAAPEANAVARELETLRQREATQNQMRDVLMGSMSSSSFGYSDFLTALGRQTQAGLWITGLTVQGDGRDMALTGRMTDASAFPQYLRRLQQEDRFRGRRFAQLELREVPDQEGVPAGITEFVLRGKLNDGAQRKATP